ncbi:hypothetical protein [Ruegeria sp. SCP11]|uniref:hypothetical protein n=1 Tax=Ruegeria sp. SCP11 TaxID=3141378 RepID=UPI003337EED3
MFSLKDCDAAIAVRRTGHELEKCGQTGLEHARLLLTQHTLQLQRTFHRVGANVTGQVIRGGRFGAS